MSAEAELLVEDLGDSRRRKRLEQLLDLVGHRRSPSSSWFVIARGSTKKSLPDAAQHHALESVEIGHAVLQRLGERGRVAPRSDTRSTMRTSQRRSRGLPRPRLRKSAT